MEHAPCLPVRVHVGRKDMAETGVSGTAQLPSDWRAELTEEDRALIRQCLAAFETRGETSR